MRTIFIILSIFIHNSFQQVIVSRSTNVIATCAYSYDAQNRYACNLFGANITNLTDTLIITGTHLPGHTDANVAALTHISASFAQFNGEALRKFVNLRFVELRRAFIGAFKQNAFEVCGQLEELSLGLISGLRTFPSRLLANCGNLRIFTDFWGHYDSYPSDLFGATRNLEEFRSTLGRINHFPDNLLQNMENLRVFNIHSMGVVNLSPNNLRNSRNLQLFDISNNHFSDAQAVMNLLNGHIELRTINIAFNSFTMFSFDFFTQFRNLLRLTLFGSDPSTSNAWQSLPRSLTHLIYYEIGENIPANAFNNLVNLIDLQLTGRGITNLHSNTFAALSNLQVLSVEQTRLTTLNSAIFTNQVNLKELRLFNNQIQSLSVGVFAPLVNLTYLDLFSNRVERLPGYSFGQHPNLNSIDFGYNQINEIQRGIFSQFAPNMILVNFNRNRCINFFIRNGTNLDEHTAFEGCFNNFDGITTTPSDGVGEHSRKFKIIVIIFVGIVLNFYY